MHPPDSVLAFSVRIEDCLVQTFHAGGHGGQNQNSRDTGVRIIHPPSGARGEAREQRSQLQNKRAALRRLAGTAAFKVWVNRELSSGPSAEERVAADLASENLRVEVRRDGRWQTWD